MRIAALLVLWMIAPGIASAGTPFKGAVTDASDTPTAGAMVLIHWDPAGSTIGLTTNIGIKQDLVIRTRQDGSFQVDLPPGFYDVFVAATAFTPVCRKIRVKPGQNLETSFRMNADALYTSEMEMPVEATHPKR
jgi:hypothetical protein